MDNQHKLIKGYRDLSPEEVHAMNRIKEVGNMIGEIVDRLSEEDVDKRWLAIAKTDLQKGFMALVRSVAKPDGF